MPIQRKLDVSKQPSTHAGLWLDRFFIEDDQGGAAGKHIKELVGHPTPEDYRDAFELRKRDFEQHEDRVISAKAHAQGRLIIGLGQKGPIEAGLHLEHTWGVPVLPGPALKGLAAATAHQLLEDDAWRKRQAGKTSFNELFGTSDETGQVIFHDAWWMPTDMIPIHLDVMTVHHSDYYRNGRVPPSDMDSPKPIAFASVTGSYLVAVEGEREWCDAALTILKIGLWELGIGAKANAGYGRIRLDYESDADKDSMAAMAEAAQLEREQKEQERYAKEMDGVISRLALNTAAALVAEGLRKYKGPLAQQFAQRVIQKLSDLSPKWLKGKQDKPWVVELMKAAKSSE